MSKAEQDRKFHKPDVIGTSADVRMKGYDQRLKMEADSPFGGLNWRSVGPERQGGRVIDIMSPKNLPGTIYVAYATGGLWRTEDQGNTWTPLFDHESAFALGSLALSDDGQTIWLGTGENNSQRTSYAGTGVFKSTDAGKTWQNMGLPETQRIGKVLIDPRNPQVAYVGAEGHLYSQNPERGVYKTTDGGKTWNQVLPLDKYTGIIDMTMDPRNSEVLYASAWDRDRRAWDFREGGAGSALYKSTNAGKTWFKLGSGFPESHDLGRIGIAQSPSHPDTIYAFIDNQSADTDTMDEDEGAPSGVLTPHRFVMLDEAELLQIPHETVQTFWSRYGVPGLKLNDMLDQVKNKKLTMAQVRQRLSENNPGLFRELQLDEEVYRSDDSGKHWKRTHPMLLGPFGGYYWGRVFVSPVNPDEVYICGVPLLRSLDGGKTWKAVARETHVDYHAYYIDPKNPKFQAVGSDGGVYFSYDSGAHWRHMENMAVGQVATVAVDNKFPFNIFCGLQDNGTLKGSNLYRPGRSDPEQWEEINGGDGAAIAVDPRDDGDVIYTSYQFGAVEGYNQKTRDRWDLTPRPQKGEPALRFNWITPILISPHQGDIIYVASQKLHRSLDKGKTWEDLGGDLTKKSHTDGNVPFDTIKDVSESPFKFGVIYIGCDDGAVKMTMDHGFAWQDISTPAKDVWVTRVVASKWDKGTVYVSQSGYREDDFTPYLWKSTDYGQHWTSMTGNLPPEPINVVREDPNKKDILYVGTDMGVFVSFDGGTVWEALSGAIPHGPVHDLAVQERDKELVAGTHSRSVWVLDLAKVYSLDKDLRAKDLFIFPVDRMTRSANWGYSNPNSGFEGAAPTLKGDIWSSKAGPATLGLKSKDGKVVKEMPINLLKGYNSFAIPLQLAPGVPFVRAKAQPKTFQDVLKDPYEASRGQFLPAGTYTIEIVRGDKTVTASWTLDSPS
jgi:photosystem II stability/assembly factor-like uncharacterized protein